ncbi:hypothetical protein [Vulcanococcus sp.]|uniref:hypothetical protein n=1 Tax=Vulcanococcus sp. TaxID=2856995 RepID=UPI003F6A2F22
MSAFFAQKAITGFAALAVAAAGTALPGSDAKAAPLIFDCYSRSTSDLLMKSALDLSNENLACVQNGMGAQVSYMPAAPQQVYVAPAPAPAPATSTGESFFGSMLGGAIGGVIGNAISGGNRNTEVHHYHDQKRGKNVGKTTADNKTNRKVILPGGATPNLMNPALRKPITLVQNTSSSSGNLGNIAIPGIGGKGGFKPPVPGKPSGRLPF